MYPVCMLQPMHKVPVCNHKHVPGVVVIAWTLDGRQ